MEPHSEETAAAESVSDGGPEQEAMLYCPVCDNRLTQHRCKLVCSRCHYYMSCADYY